MVTSDCIHYNYTILNYVINFGDRAAEVNILNEICGLLLESIVSSTITMTPIFLCPTTGEPHHLIYTTRTLSSRRSFAAARADAGLDGMNEPVTYHTNVVLCFI